MEAVCSHNLCVRTAKAAKQHRFSAPGETGDKERMGQENPTSPASLHLARPLPLSFSFSFSWQEKPKSVSLMFMSSSSRMFSGFRSRWTMLMECRYWITSSSARMIFLGVRTAHPLSQIPTGTMIPGMGTGTGHRDTAQGAVLPARSPLKPTLCSCKVIFTPLPLALPGFLLTQGDFLSEVVKELPSLHPAGGRGNRDRQRLSCNSKPALSPWGGSIRSPCPLTAQNNFH